MAGLITESNRKWWILSAMTGSLAMIMIDQTVVSVALPRMQHELGLSLTGTQWVVNAFMLSLAAFMAVGGKVGDSLGRPRVFIAGVVLFALASAVCGFAVNQAQILAGRALQGLGAALMQPASAAIVVGCFAPGERGKAMALYAGAAMSLMTAGPLVGGLLTEYLSWRYAFHINQPVAAWAVLMTLAAKPEDKPDRQSVNWGNLAVYLLGLPSLVLALQQGNEWGWLSPAVLTAGTWGLAALGLFMVLERRAASPLLSLSLFKDVSFAADVGVMAAVQGSMAAQVLFGSIYLQRVLHFSPAKAGVSMLFLIVPVLVMAQVAGRVYDRIGARRPVLFGLSLFAAGLLYQALVAGLKDFTYVAPGMSLLGLGMGWIMTPVNTDALSRASDEARGQASGLIQTSRQVGGSLGLALSGALFGLAGGTGLHQQGEAAVAALTRGIAAAYLLAAVTVLVALMLAARHMSPGRTPDARPVPGRPVA